MSNGNSKDRENPDKEEEGEDAGKKIVEETRQVEVELVR